MPYAPGGSTDVVARMLGEKLAAKFGQPVLVENRPGASEQIASAYVAKSTADGYTIMLATMAGLAVNPWLYQLPYDVLHDFAPIVTAVKMPSFIVVNPQTPVKSVPQLTDYLRNNRVSYATAGTGTPSHLAMEMYKKYAKVDAESVQYKGGAPALQDVMAGHVPVMVALAPEALPYIKGQAQGPGRDQRRAVSLSSRRARGHRIPRPQGLRDRSMAGLRGAGGRPAPSSTRSTRPSMKRWRIRRCGPGWPSCPSCRRAVRSRTSRS